MLLQEVFLLCDRHIVFLGRQNVGTVQVLQQGLYYRIKSRCELSGDVICRLWVDCGEQSMSLGVMVPVDGMFELDTSIPMKRFGGKILKFYLMPMHETSEDTFAPIYPEEPFSYIARLKDTFLQYQNGQMGIKIEAGTE